MKKLNEEINDIDNVLYTVAISRCYGKVNVVSSSHLVSSFILPIILLKYQSSIVNSIINPNSEKEHNTKPDNIIGGVNSTNAQLDNRLWNKENNDLFNEEKISMPNKNFYTTYKKIEQYVINFMSMPSSTNVASQINDAYFLNCLKKVEK